MKPPSSKAGARRAVYKFPRQAEDKGMSRELMDVLIQVIKSWEVLAVTGVLIIYFFLISHTARGRRRSRTMARTSLAGKAKAAPVGEPDVETTGDDDLGLSEE